MGSVWARKQLAKKSNEITAIPKLLEKIQIKGQIITIDAMGTQKAHAQMERREYYQSEDIGWMSQRKEWNGIKSIGMEEKTI